VFCSPDSALLPPGEGALLRSRAGWFPMARAAKTPDAPPPPDPMHQVHGLVRLYDCPDLAAVDSFLVELTDRISRATKLPKLVAQYKSDMDSLLDRRAFLHMTSPGDHKPTDTDNLTSGSDGRGRRGEPIDRKLIQ
jgi:hypothetical protein